MRTLKRMLSLMLAAAVLLGVMTVCAGAAEAGGAFMDTESGKNGEAAASLTALGLLDGEDGDLSRLVTRAEMAQLVTLCLNGGRDPIRDSGAVAAQFTDVEGHWAEPYIAYCANLGIAGGVGGGLFGPDEPVTGTIAARMLLVALGYRADIEGLTGAAWDLNTDILAVKVGLYIGLEHIVPSDALSLADTAQLICNALQADEVVYRSRDGGFTGSIYAQPLNGEEDSSMLWDRFGIRKAEGVITANSVFALDGGGRTEEGTIRLGDVEIDGVRCEEADGIYQAAADSGMVGRRAVLYLQYEEGLSQAADGVVMGQPILSDTNVVAVTADLLDSETAVRAFASGSSLVFRYSGADDGYCGVYEAAKDGSRLCSAERPQAADCVTSAPGVEQILIDHDGDRVVDYLIRTTDHLAKVNTYDRRSERLSLVGAGSISFQDAVGWENVERDDIVLYHKLGRLYYLYPAGTVTGTVTGYSAETAKIILDDVTYSPSAVGRTTAGTALSGLFTGEIRIGGAYTLYLDRFGNAVAKAYL